MPCGRSILSLSLMQAPFPTFGDQANHQKISDFKHIHYLNGSVHGGTGPTYAHFSVVWYERNDSHGNAVACSSSLSF